MGTLLPLWSLVVMVVVGKADVRDMITPVTGHTYFNHLTGFNTVVDQLTS